MSHSVPTRRSSRPARRCLPFLITAAGAVALVPSAVHAASNTWLTPPGPGVGTPPVGVNFLASSAALSGDGERAVFRYFQTAPFVLATPPAVNPAQLILVESGSGTGPRIISRASGAEGALGNAAASGSSSVQTADFDLSDDGGTVVFASLATNLVAGDTNSAPDVFARQLDGEQRTERVNLDDVGTQATSTTGAGVAPTVSDDGRYVAFSAAGVANWQTQNFTFPATGWNATTYATFVRDRQTQRTTVVSAKNGTDDVVAGLGEARISGDGRFVAFRSRVADVAGPGVPAAQTSISAAPLYLRELATKRTILVSQDRDGSPVAAFQPQVSADGRYVLFASSAANLVELPEGVTQPAHFQVYLRDTVDGTTTLVSAALDGTPADQAAGNNATHATSRGEMRLSSDGRYVSYNSSATNLVDLRPGESALGQVVVWDRVTNARIRNGVADDGSQGLNPSTGAAANAWPADFADGGRLAGFASFAKDLVPGWVGAISSPSPLSYNVVHHQYVRDLSTAPAATTGGASAVTQTSATVAGELDVPGPDFGFQATEYTVEYGTTTAYGASVPGDGVVAGGTADAALSFDLTGLQPGTTYHYRVVATNGAGTVQGEDRTFTTAATPVDGGGGTPPDGESPPRQDPPQQGPRVELPPVVDAPAAVKSFRLTATASRASLRLATVRRQGLRLTVGVDGAASVRVRATVSAAVAKRLGLPVPKGAKRVTVGSGSSTTKASGRKTIRVTLTNATRQRLSRAGSSVAIRVAVTASGKNRKTTTLARTVKVRR